MQLARALACALLTFALLLLAGVQVGPSLRTHTAQMLADRAHRRLLERQDPAHLDVAGLKSLRRIHAMRRQGRNGHVQRHERDLAAASPAGSTPATPVTTIHNPSPPASSSQAKAPAPSSRATGTAAGPASGITIGGTAASPEEDTTVASPDESPVATTTAAGPAGSTTTTSSPGTTTGTGAATTSGFGTVATGSVLGPAAAASVTPAAAPRGSGAVTGTVEGTGSNGGVFIPG